MDFKFSAGLMVVAIATSGLSACAPAYHCVPCDGVPYAYDAPPPLPYTRYSGCPTPIAERYRNRSAPSVSNVPDGVDSERPSNVSPVDSAKTSPDDGPIDRDSP